MIRQSAAVLRGREYEQGVSVVVLSVRLCAGNAAPPLLPEALVMVGGSGRAGKPEAVMAMKRHRVAALGRMGNGATNAQGRGESSSAGRAVSPAGTAARMKEDGRGAEDEGMRRKKPFFF